MMNSHCLSVRVPYGPHSTLGQQLHASVKLCANNRSYAAKRIVYRIYSGSEGDLETSGQASQGSGEAQRRSRQEVEAEYYKEWERLTLVPEEELNRKMTVVTFLRFLPMWLRYNGLPGPVRYLVFAKGGSKVSQLFKRK